MIQPNEKLIDGIRIVMAGVEYVIPPLTIGQLKRQRPTIERLAQVKIEQGSISSLSDDLFNDFSEIIREAMSRNYRDITIDDVQELLDLKNVQPVIAAVMGISGLVRMERPPGETAAASQASIGMPSTPTSSPSPAGPGNTSTTS